MDAILSESDSWAIRQEAIALLQDQAKVFFYLGSRVRLFRDGNQWCALYGENLQEGIVGFGDSPHQAVCAFNDAWYTSIEEATDAH